MLGALLRRLRMLAGRRRLSSDLDEELRAHVAELEAEYEADGHSAAEAARLARLRLGGRTQIGEAARDVWRLGRLEDWTRDGRLAARGLARRPAFALAAIATLTLGIGASTAIFSVAYGVTVRPLPYPEPDRLVRLYEANLAAGEPRHEVSVPAFHHWRTDAPAIASASLFTMPRTRYLVGDLSAFITMGVSPNFFRVLGVAPALGPGFRDEHEYTRFTTAELVITHAAWQRVLGGRTDVIGQTLQWTTDDTPFVIVGVMPEGFRFQDRVDGWTPGLIVEQPFGVRRRTWRYDRVIARLAPGATVEGARAELEAVAARLAAEFPAYHGGWSVTVDTLRDAVIGRFGRATWLLMAAVGVVLLVACLNVGGLFVARAIGRDRETAVRLALGAGRWELARLWLAEATLVAGAGVVAGLGLAALGVQALQAAAPPGIPRLEDIRIDGPALAVGLVAGVLAALAFALAPLGRLGRAPVAGRLRAGTSGAGETPTRLRGRSLTLAAQSAGAAVLVLLSLVLSQSFRDLMRTDTGWEPRGLLSLRPGPPIPDGMNRPWYWFLLWSDNVVAQLEATPGIVRAAVTTQVPLGPDPFVSTLERGGEDAGAGGATWPAVTHNVTDGYFATAGLRLIEGRAFERGDRFTEAQLVDRADASPGIAIVSASVARELWPGRSAIGQWIRLPDVDNAPGRQIVGVVEDLQFYAVGEPPALHVFVPWSQLPTGRPRLIVRTSGEASALAAVVRDIVQSVVPGTTVDQLVLQEDLVLQATAQPRFTTRLMAAFAAVALGLAAVGVYGTLAFLVASRRREIGIRLALGARPRQALARVLAAGLGPVLAGAAAGVGVAWVAAAALGGAVDGLSSPGVAAATIGAIVVVVVAIAAAAGPARRAATVDPLAELRAD